MEKTIKTDIKLDVHMHKLEDRIQEINDFKVEYQKLKETMTMDFKDLRKEIEGTPLKRCKNGKFKRVLNRKNSEMN